MSKYIYFDCLPKWVNEQIYEHVDYMEQYKWRELFARILVQLLAVTEDISTMINSDNWHSFSQKCDWFRKSHFSIHFYNSPVAYKAHKRLIKYQYKCTFEHRNMHLPTTWKILCGAKHDDAYLMYNLKKLWGSTKNWNEHAIALHKYMREHAKMKPKVVEWADHCIGLEDIFI